jgi:hypothetical protein
MVSIGFYFYLKLVSWPMLPGDYHPGFPEIDFFIVSQTCVYFLEAKIAKNVIAK